MNSVDVLLSIEIEYERESINRVKATNAIITAIERLQMIDGTVRIRAYGEATLTPTVEVVDVRIKDIEE